MKCQDDRKLNRQRMGQTNY